MCVSDGAERRGVQRRRTEPLCCYAVSCALGCRWGTGVAPARARARRLLREVCAGRRAGVRIEKAWRWCVVEHSGVCIDNPDGACVTKKIQAKSAPLISLYSIDTYTPTPSHTNCPVLGARTAILAVFAPLTICPSSPSVNDTFGPRLASAGSSHHQ